MLSELSSLTTRSFLLVFVPLLQHHLLQPLLGFGIGGGSIVGQNQVDQIGYVGQDPS